MSNSDANMVGAKAATVEMHNNATWRLMSTAPRDGTWVELKCTYGVAPWYCVARWTDEQLAHDQDGRLVPFKAAEASWVKPEGGGPFDEKSLLWRPFSGDATAYIDPANGMQNDAAYWRGAVAAKYGLPADHFEAEARENGRRRGPHQGLLRRLFNLFR